MKKTSTILVWSAVLLISLGGYFFPLWNISLDAPQYPEGMGMRIWVDRVTGEKPHDLQNINGLNHYIGMQEIHAESIPELRFMKFIVAALVLIGIFVGIVRRRWALVTWFVILILAAGIGLADFYKWTYDYGHNLDPDAPIKVPGMSYQPPIFGTKQMLNIRASSFPGLGGLGLLVGTFLVFIAVVLEFRRGAGTAPRRSRGKAPPPAKELTAVGVLFALVLGVSGCSSGPDPIRYGIDACDFCRMTITQRGHGAELVTDKGRVYKYDAVECMANQIARGEVKSAGSLLLVIDHEDPDKFVAVADAGFLHSEHLRSPMGMNLTGFASPDRAMAATEHHPGSVLTWTEVQRLVAPGDADANGSAHGGVGSR